MYCRPLFRCFEKSSLTFAQHPGLVNKLLTVSRELFLQSIHHRLGHCLLSVILRLLCRHL
jgi:hypothetical protein